MNATVTDTFYRPCLDCGLTVETVNGGEQPHACEPVSGVAELVARAYWAGHDRGKSQQ